MGFLVMSMAFSVLFFSIPGLKLDQPLNTGWPPFLHACESCRPEVLELFLDRGADPNTAKGKCRRNFLITFWSFTFLSWESVKKSTDFSKITA